MSAALWTHDDVAQATGGGASVPFTASGVSIDTRSLRAGDMFVALKGPVHDGHAFVGDAFAKGAAAALVAHEDKNNTKGAYVQVADTYAALVALGRFARKRASARIAAITGSVGKTGTKDALAAALAEQGGAHVAEASYNNQWGVPLSLARMPRDVRFAIFEIGMNHPGEITPLAQLTAPDIAIVTNVQPAHLAFFRDVEEIAEAKAEIFAGLKPGGSAILNRDCTHYDLLHTRARAAGAGHIYSFGIHKESDARLEHFESSENRVVAHVFGEKLSYRLGKSGRHEALNSLAILAAVHAMGADVHKAAQSLGAVRAGAGRGKTHTLRLGTGEARLIDESYNASPASMRAALDVLGESVPEGKGRRIAVLGAMAELGAQASQLHKDLAAPLRAAHVDHLFACGADMAHLVASLADMKNATHAETAAALQDKLCETLRAGDVVMVKGSRAEALDRLVAHLLKAFNGREAAS